MVGSIAVEAETVGSESNDRSILLVELAEAQMLPAGPSMVDGVCIGDACVDLRYTWQVGGVKDGRPLQPASAEVLASQTGGGATRAIRREQVDLSTPR